MPPIRTTNGALVCGWSPSGSDSSLSPDPPIPHGFDYSGSIYPPPLTPSPLAPNEALTAVEAPSTSEGEHVALGDSKPRGRKSKHPPNHIPRPSNPFILFRRDFCRSQKNRTMDPENHRGPSYFASIAWRQTTGAERKKWVDLAQAEKEEHKRLYPEYKYRPNRRGQAAKSATLNEPAKSTKGRSKRAQSTRTQPISQETADASSSNTPLFSGRSVPHSPLTNHTTISPSYNPPKLPMPGPSPPVYGHRRSSSAPVYLSGASAGLVPQNALLVPEPYSRSPYTRLCKSESQSPAKRTQDLSAGSSPCGSSLWTLEPVEEYNLDQIQLPQLPPLSIDNPLTNFSLTQDGCDQYVRFTPLHTILNH
jgi:hypothetical protein